jgi:hypothetical protein
LSVHYEVPQVRRDLQQEELDESLRQAVEL